MQSGEVLAAEDGAVLTLTLNRPDKLNALTGAMYRDLVDLLAFAGDSDDVRAVLILGAGKSFSAGNDLADFL
ncbi:MAG TPA: crotonase, partial [Alcanivorax sp.]|nr:crotonase [Alcanivorax sp.]